MEKDIRDTEKTMQLRPELEPLPIRMHSLPIDRGYPVPWFVEWVTKEGLPVPEFRAMSPVKWVKAVKQRLCWVCGHRMGANLAFLIGPMCGITRTTSEPANHRECAVWSARNCPFLSRPHAERREPDVPYLEPAGFMIKRNPGVSLVWVTKGYKIFNDGKNQPLIEVGDPEEILFYSEGKPASYDQIRESVETGLPFLREKVQSKEDEADLQILIDRFWALVSAIAADSKTMVT